MNFDDVASEVLVLRARTRADEVNILKTLTSRERDLGVL